MSRTQAGRAQLRFSVRAAMRLKLRRNGGTTLHKLKVSEDGSNLIDEACLLFNEARSPMITFYDDEGVQSRPRDCEDELHVGSGQGSQLQSPQGREH